MNLFLLRHGIAEERRPAIADARRALTTEGRRKLRKVVNAMRAMELRFDVLLTSPLVRAVQTAEGVVRGFSGQLEIQLCQALRPGATGPQIVKALQALPREASDILVVGHEPDLSGLISQLAFGKPVAAVELKKGGLCKLAIPSLKCGQCATLEWLLTPRQMFLMTGSLS